MPMVMFMMVCGKMIKPTAKEFIVIQMVQNMTETGQKTNSTAKVLKHGQMGKNMRVIMLMEKSMVMENLLVLTVVLTQDNLKKTIFKGRAHTIGLVAVSSQEHGSTTKWKVQGFIHGLMEEDMTESI